jgi:hypothetical protein
MPRSDRARVSIAGERGTALIFALASMSLLMALGGALLTLTSTEAAIAARFRDGLQASYAAEAALGRAMLDLRSAPDWVAFVEAAAGRPYLDGSLDLVVPGAALDVSLARMSVSVSLEGSPEGTVTIRAVVNGPLAIRRIVEGTVAHDGEGIRLALWRAGP